VPERVPGDRSLAGSLNAPQAVDYNPDVPRRGLRLAVIAVVWLGMAAPALAQDPPPATRAAAIGEDEAAKAGQLTPYKANGAEHWAQKAEEILMGGLHWYPYFQSAYSGGGFTLGAGYKRYVSAFNTVDVRGSYTIKGYKRVEAEFRAPRLFKRHGDLSIIGGWRDATQVGYHGLGNESSTDARSSYRFKQPYLTTALEVRPTRGALLGRGEVEWSEWSQEPGQADPSIETVFTPETAPGLGARVQYLRSTATVGLDFREAADYSRRGGYFAVTGHDYNDRDGNYGFTQIDYTAIQHIPILREAWVISLHGTVSQAREKGGELIPFFMMPALGGGSTLRGYSAWRFRDRNRMLLQAEWRIMFNRFLDGAFFYDAGKVTAHAADLDFDDLRSDFGFGVRFHGPLSTPLRIDLAKSKEGFHLVFSSQSVF
jgi:hypothetical protein